MKVLVTGGAGYVGTELVCALADRSDVSEVIVYDNLSRGNRNLFILASVGPKPIRFVRGDLLDTRKLETALEGIDVVFHLAAKVTTPFADQEFHSFDQINHWGTAELSYLLERHPVDRLVYLSSTSVYGASSQEVAGTETPSPNTTYGLSKYNGERMLDRLRNVLTLQIFRCGNVYGYSPSMRFDAVINRFMFGAHWNGRVTVHGSGRQQRAFVHVANAVRALTSALDGIPPGTYNLVERNLSLLEITSHVKNLCPDLETLFIQQDIKLRNLQVLPDPRLTALQIFEECPFDEQLLDIRQHFSF